MPIAVGCEDCGKIYSISSSMIGKKVKCKACGHVFAVAAPVPPDAEPDFVEVLKPSERTMEVASKFYPTTIVLLSCLPVAILAGLAATRFPGFYQCGLIGFPILGILFLLVGMVVVTIRSVHTPGSFSFPWRESLSTIIPLLFGLLVGLVIVRRNRGFSLKVGSFYNRTADIVARSIGVALMTLLVFLTSVIVEGYSGKHTPSALEQRVAESERNGGVRSPVFTPPPQLSLMDVPENVAEGVLPDPGLMVKSERNLRLIASAVFTYRANAHKNAATLAQLFQYFPETLRSPFAPENANSYVYLPQNITGNRDDNIVLYDYAELAKTGRTQALTNSFHVLKLSREELLSRSEIPR